MKQSAFNFFVDYPPDNVHIAFNCASGGLYIFNDDHFKEVEALLADPNKTLNNDDAGIREKLIAGRFIIDDDMDEMQILKLRNNLSRHNPNGIAMVIAPSLNCNLNCPYCYVDREKKTMSQDTIESIKKFFDNRIEHSSGVSLSWTGGEPLLALDIVEDLNNHFRKGCSENKKPFDCNIVSNGVLLNPSNVDRLKACGLSKIQITLDGTPEFHNKLRFTSGGKGTFNTILENVVYASNNGMRVTIRSNVEKDNYRSIYNLIDILAESNINFDQSVFAPCVVSEIKTETGGPFTCNTFSNQEFSNHEPELLYYAAQRGFRIGKGVLSTRHAYCGANTLPLHVIDSYGNVLKCWCNLGRADTNMVGKINSDGVVEYTNYKNFAKWMCWDPFDIEECKKCKVLPLCMGGCMYYNVMGDTDQIDIGCSHRRHNLEKILKVFYLSATKTKEQLNKITL